MLNKKAVFEVGDIIHVRRNWNFKTLSAQEILDSVQYQKEFKARYPELSKLVERQEDNNPTQEDIVGNKSFELGQI